MDYSINLKIVYSFPRLDLGNKELNKKIHKITLIEDGALAK